MDCIMGIGIFYALVGRCRSIWLARQATRLVAFGSSCHEFGVCPDMISCWEWDQSITLVLKSCLKGYWHVSREQSQMWMADSPHYPPSNKRYQLKNNNCLHTQKAVIEPNAAGSAFSRPGSIILECCHMCHASNVMHLFRRCGLDKELCPRLTPEKWSLRAHIRQWTAKKGDVEFKGNWIVG